MDEYSSGPTSLLAVLSLYSKLRREGASLNQTRAKLESLIVQLSADDQQELARGIEDWETKQGKQIDNIRDGDANDLFGTTQTSAEPQAFPPPNTISIALKSLRPPIRCVKCGRHNEPDSTICVECGTNLKEVPAESPETQQASWFGPASRLRLTILKINES